MTEILDQVSQQNKASPAWLARDVAYEYLATNRNMAEEADAHERF
jgi:hypothetical protein